jgi:hypothetical protein
VKLEPRDTPEPAISIASTRSGAVRPLLISGAALVGVSIGLLIAGLVTSNQLQATLSRGGLIPGTRAEAQATANTANALATGSLISGLLGVGLATAGGVVWLVER